MGRTTIMLALALVAASTTVYGAGMFSALSTLIGASVIASRQLTHYGPDMWSRIFIVPREAPLLHRPGQSAEKPRPSLAIRTQWSPGQDAAPGPLRVRPEGRRADRALGKFLTGVHDAVFATFSEDIRTSVVGSWRAVGGPRELESTARRVQASLQCCL